MGTMFDVFQIRLSFGKQAQQNNSSQHYLGHHIHMSGVRGARIPQLGAPLQRGLWTGTHAPSLRNTMIHLHTTSTQIVFVCFLILYDTTVGNQEL